MDNIKKQDLNFHYDELEYEYRYDSRYDLTADGRMDKTIFIAVPCYRDEDVINTVESAYLNAKNPDRIFFGIAVIYKEGDDPYWLKLDEYENVKYDLKLSTMDTVGLGRQRETANSMFADQDYYLQIDAHMRFDMHWDDLLIHHIENLKILGEQKPLITGYPRAFAPDGPYVVEGHYPFYNRMSKELYFREKSGSNHVPGFRTGRTPAEFFKEYGFLRHGDRHFAKHEVLALAKTVSPAQIFVDGSFVRDVPANPDIRFLEEEQYYSILAFMQGYNFYVPKVTGIMHYYANAGDQVLINRNSPMQEFPDAFTHESYSENNLGGIQIFKDLQSMKKTARSFKDYEEFAHVDYNKRVMKAPVDRVYQNKITAAINFMVEINNYSVGDYSEWMYNPSYMFYEDVIRNETPQQKE